MHIKHVSGGTLLRGYEVAELEVEHVVAYPHVPVTVKRKSRTTIAVLLQAKIARMNAKAEWQARRKAREFKHTYFLAD